MDAGGYYADDPYPRWHELRTQAAVHPGTVHELTGYEGDAMFHGLPFPDRPHFSTFSYAACDAAYRNPEVFASSPGAADGSPDDIGIRAKPAHDGWYQAPPLPVPRAALIHARQSAVVDPELD